MTCSHDALLYERLQMDILNITNGSNTTDLMIQANILGDHLSWDDLLHEGPVPANLSLAALSAVRADYLVKQGYADKAQVTDKFRQRDTALRNYAQYNKVILWFEHDLYDQLQLIQILDWFNQQTSIETELKLICVDKHLSRHTPEEFSRLINFEKIITRSQLDLATQAWQTFTSSTAGKLGLFLTQDLSPLAYLEAALTRLSLEYPDKQSGLPLTERLVLQALEKGALSPVALFKKYQQLENAEFMGDMTFWLRLNQMAFGKVPALELSVQQQIGYPINPKQKISISSFGHQCLKGKAHWYNNNHLKRYIGGYQVLSQY